MMVMLLRNHMMLICATQEVDGEAEAAKADRSLCPPHPAVSILATVISPAKALLHCQDWQECGH